MLEFTSRVWEQRQPPRCVLSTQPLMPGSLRSDMASAGAAPAKVMAGATQAMPFAAVRRLTVDELLLPGLAVMEQFPAVD